MGDGDILLGVTGKERHLTEGSVSDAVACTDDGCLAPLFSGTVHQTSALWFPVREATAGAE